jgi:hypothetical protein
MMVVALAVVLFGTGIGCDREADSPGPSRAQTGSDDPTPRPKPTVGDDPGLAGDDETSVGRRITDRKSQRSTTGAVPDFVEIDEVALQAKRGSLSLSMSLAGKVPDLMPDEVTTMRVTFVIVTKGGDRYEFFAHATRNGWAQFASGRDDAEPPFTDELSISGRTLVMTLDPAYLGPPAPFKWTANVAWTRRAQRGEAFAFDFVPKKGYADFP